MKVGGKGFESIRNKAHSVLTNLINSILSARSYQHHRIEIASPAKVFGGWFIVNIIKNDTPSRKLELSNELPKDIR